MRYSGEDHLREAEFLLDRAQEAESGVAASLNLAAYYVAKAQVHAALAQAHAMAMLTAVGRGWVPPVGVPGPR